jgi:NarL family two-component system sensor histidine kinase LiaS
MARDLHDSVKQHMFATAMQLGAVASAMLSGAASASDLLRDARVTVKCAYDELTALIGALRPSALQDRGLASALRDLAESWQRQGLLTVGLSISGERPLPIAIEHALYRIAQEALTNCARHGGTGQAQVGLSMQADQIALSIRDRGKGLDEAGAAPGMGLESMRSRAAEIGGQLALLTSPGAGTVVTVTVPAPAMDV